MTRAHRIWHRRLIAGVFLLLVTAALIALTHRAPDPRLDAWPPALERLERHR